VSVGECVGVNTCFECPCESVLLRNPRYIYPSPLVLVFVAVFIVLTLFCSNRVGCSERVWLCVGECLEAGLLCILREIYICVRLVSWCKVAPYP
jgi:hypothetical protein